MSLFRLCDLKSLFKNKHIVVMGDSVQRCVYKDLVLATQDERLLTPEELKAKGEPSCCNDKLLFRSELNNGRNFLEAREYQSKDGFFLIQYYFLTRCYDARMEDILGEFKQYPPDLIIMNSCMWDISRYGPKGEDEYYVNMNKLCTRMREVLPPTTMLLWTTTMPIASEIASGFLLEEIQFMSEFLRVAVLEANYHVTQIVTAYGFDVLDLHFYFRALMDHREKDGVHWDAFANRHIIDLISMFLYDSWGIPVPDHTMEQIKATDFKTDLRHFTYTGIPSFVKASKLKLEKLVKKDGDPDDEVVEGVIEEKEEENEDAEKENEEKENEEGENEDDENEDDENEDDESEEKENEEGESEEKENQENIDQQELEEGELNGKENYNGDEDADTESEASPSTSA